MAPSIPRKPAQMTPTHPNDSLGTNLQTRAQIVHGAANGPTNRQISAQYGIEVHRIGTCAGALIKRWKRGTRLNLSRVRVRDEWLEDANHPLGGIFASFLFPSP